MKTILKIAFAALFAASLSACALDRSTITLDQAKLDAPVSSQFTPVKIVTVTDGRYFDPAPPNPDTPSLAKEDIGNAALKARAIGRKRNGYGMALGDVVLPEGTTVSVVVRTAVANGFKQAGYRVVEAGDPDYDKAAPVDVRVDKYWCWVQMGFWALKVHNASEVELTGVPGAAQPKLTVQGGVAESSMAVTESRWKETATKGLAALTQNVAAALRGQPQEIVNHNDDPPSDQNQAAKSVQK